MSITDAVNRIQQIESQIVQLSSVEPTATAGTAGAAATAAVGATTGTAQTSSANASAFASTLAAATAAPGATVTPGAGQLAENGTTGADVVADAQKYLGVPYVFGGTTSAGLDCSGLVQRVYADLGISLPRVVEDQKSIGEAVPSLADAQPGDLIVCNGGEHIVIYAGNGKIIQAPKPGGQVEEMNNWITPSNVVTIRRIVPSSGASAAPASTSPSGTAAPAAAIGATGLTTSAASQAVSGAGAVTGSAATDSSASAILTALLTSGIESSLSSALLGASGTSGLLGSSSGLLGSSSTGGAFGSSGMAGLTSLLAALAGAEG